MFRTKDSGKRSEYTTGMVRDTQEGKARFDLLFPRGIPYAKQILTRFADLMARGAEKYTERNWEKARTQEELDRYHSSALRHLIQWMSGEVDEDHAAAVMFNIMAGEFVKEQLAADFSWMRSKDEPTEKKYPCNLVPEGRCNYPHACPSVCPSIVHARCELTVGHEDNHRHGYIEGCFGGVW